MTTYDDQFSFYFARLKLARPFVGQLDFGLRQEYALALLTQLPDGDGSGSEELSATGYRRQGGIFERRGSGGSGSHLYLVDGVVFGPFEPRRPGIAGLGVLRPDGRALFYGPAQRRSDAPEARWIGLTASSVELRPWG